MRELIDLKGIWSHSANLKKDESLIGAHPLHTNWSVH